MTPNLPIKIKSARLVGRMKILATFRSDMEDHMNQVNLVGRWTRKPELRYTQSGTAVASVNIAVDRPLAKEGQQDVDFIPVVIWGKAAEVASEYTDKGTLVSVNGSIQVRKYTAQDGSDRWATEVVARSVQFLSKVSNGQRELEQYSDEPLAVQDEQDVMDEEIAR
jgi:single-strand DNA-binding protein